MLPSTDLPATPITALWREYLETKAQFGELEDALAPANRKAASMMAPPPAEIQVASAFAAPSGALPFIETFKAFGGDDVRWVAAEGWRQVARREPCSRAAARARALASIAERYAAEVAAVNEQTGVAKIDAELSQLDDAESSLGQRMLCEPATCLADLRIQLGVGSSRCRGGRDLHTLCDSIEALAART